MTSEARKIISSTGSFISGLTWIELVRLRAAVRRGLALKGLRVDEREADRIIESWGAEVAEMRLARLLRSQGHRVR